MQCTLKQDLAIKAEKRDLQVFTKNKKEKNKTTVQTGRPELYASV